MKCKIIGKNVAVTDSIKSAIEEKLRRMDKYFIINEDITANVLIRTYKTKQKIEITIFTKMMDFRVEVSEDDLYAAIDLAVDKLEGQMRKLKTKLDRRHKESLGEAIAFENIQNEEDMAFMRKIIINLGFYFDNILYIFNNGNIMAEKSSVDGF